MADTTTSVLTAYLQNLYNYDAMQAFTQGGQFWRAGLTGGHIVAGLAGAGGKDRGKALVFDIWAASTVSTAALSENDDGTATSLATDQVTVTLVEQGAYTHTTHKLRETSYGDVEAQAAWMMGNNAVQVMDTLARGALDSETGATWVDYAGAATAVNTVTIGDELSGTDVRKAWAKLRYNNVPKMADGYYWAFIHPHVFKDLLDETGADSWVQAVQYSGKADPLDPISDEAGIYSGFRFIITANAYMQSKAGHGTTTSAASADVYTTYFLGKDALAFGYKPNAAGQPLEIKVGQPQAVGGIDVYERFQTISWYALCGFSALRADSLFKIFSSSSMAANGA